MVSLRENINAGMKAHEIDRVYLSFHHRKVFKIKTHGRHTH